MLRLRHRFAALLCTTVLVLTLSTGCYGKFALTKAVYDFNSQVEDEIARSIVTAVLIIFPAYEFAGLADWILFNTLEFWTGKNPITEKVTNIRRSDSGEIEAVSTTRRTADRLETVIESYRQDQHSRTLILWQQTGDTQIHADLVWPNGTVEQYLVYAGQWADNTMRPLARRTNTRVTHAR